jgi:TolA-binding protein
VISFVGISQTTEKYNSDYENFYRAEELFQKEQFGAARKEFRYFMDGFNYPNDPLFIKAAYYEGVSALELFNNDAVTLLENFIRNYPESIYSEGIYFRLGRYFYQKKN